MIKKSLAFTLGEILIALSVIGVVAILVMPSLVVGQKAAKAQAQFNTAYSLMAKAIADMDADDVSIDPNKYPTQKFYPEFIKYNKISYDCGNNGTTASRNPDVCPSSGSKYKSLSSGNIASNVLDDGGFVLTNGMMVGIENCKGCTYGDDHNIWLVVDVNGYNQNPNRAGQDLFMFQVTKEGVYPLGAPETDKKFSEDPKKYCCLPHVNPGCTSGESNYNGFTCAYFAVTDQDYFKKVYKGH